MRTDGSTEGPGQTGESGAGGRIHDLSLSRRQFVLASGVAAAPLASGSGAANRVGRRVIVGATAPYRPTVGPLAREFEQSTGSSVELRRTSARPGRALAGDLDVLVSGRPVSATDLRGGDAVGIAVAGWGTLARPDGEWRECLSGRELGERPASPVETWSETTWPSARVASERRRDASECGQSVSDRETGTTLVRGTRSYQYARGHGGVGYYEVAADDVHRRENLRGGDAGARVPLLRVGHVYADGEARDGERVGRFLQFYGDRALTAADGVEYFAGPPDAETGRLLWA